MSLSKNIITVEEALEKCYYWCISTKSNTIYKIEEAPVGGEYQVLENNGQTIDGIFNQFKTNYYFYKVPPFSSKPSDNPPTEEEIDETFDLIQDRLEDPLMSHPDNAQVKLGYEVALDILDSTKSLADIMQVKGVQASAIAVLAADYLKGECNQDVLVNVPLKGTKIKPM